MEQPLKTSFTKHERGRARGTHEREALYEILDATPICHFGHNVDGRPVVTPTCHWRDGDTLYWHGSRISRALQAAEDNEVCITVTLFDGLVLARSAFHHSANFRSAMVFGTARLVDDEQEKLHSLKVFIDKLLPDRWETLRPVTDKEMAATSVLKLPIEEGSAKIRQGPPNDDAADLDYPVWAGVVPIFTHSGTPMTAPDMQMVLPVPDHATNYLQAARKPS